MEIGHPKIAALIDEQDWNKANVEGCRKPKTSSDCQGLSQYIQEHPDGAHVGEARTALDKSRDKIKALERKDAREKKAEEKKQEAEEKRAERAELQQKKEDCKQNCKERCFGVRPAVYGLCISRCVDTYCNDRALREQ